jgi:serine/threonine protein kinase
MFFVDIVKNTLSIGSVGIVYLVKDKTTKNRFILKATATIQNAAAYNNSTTVNSASLKKKEIEGTIHKLEEFIGSWKDAMKKSEYVVKYIDHWYDDAKEYSYILMEYCSKGDLSFVISNRIKKGDNFSEEVFFLFYFFIGNIDKYLNNKEILKYGSEITCGLLTLHKVGIIHRDIKPANVYITEDGNCRVGLI